MSLKVTGGWLRENLSYSLCNEYIENSFKNFPPEANYDGNCKIPVLERDLDVLVMSKVSQK